MATEITAGMAADGANATITAAHTANPPRLAMSTVRLSIVPRTSGRSGADSASVSVWKTSVSAWPSPYDANSATNAGTTRAIDGCASARPTKPAAPDTNIKYGRHVSQSA